MRTTQSMTKLAAGIALMGAALMAGRTSHPEPSKTRCDTKS